MNNHLLQKIATGFNENVFCATVIGDLFQFETFEELSVEFEMVKLQIYYNLVNPDLCFRNEQTKTIP